MKSKTFRLLGIALAIALVAAIALSQTVKRTHMHRGDMFGEFMMHHMAEQLNLTDAQQAQMKDIAAKAKPAIEPLHQEMAQGHQQMMQLVTSGNFDEAKAREIAAQQALTMTEMEVQHARVAAEMFQVLTPDQKTKAIQLMNEKHQHWMNHGEGQNAPPPTQN